MTELSATLRRPSAAPAAPPEPTHASNDLEADRPAAGHGRAGNGDGRGGDAVAIAIDGPAASGKTTVARLLAARLGYLYLDTGAMYRALALSALRAGTDLQSEHAILALLRARPIAVVLDPEAPLGYRISAGGEELGDELFGPEVSAVVSVVAAQPDVRAEMVAQQRRIATGGPVVMAGRDIGTVVLPSAGYKIFLTASVEARAERRRGELAASGVVVDAATVREQLEERDRLDASRAVAPLRPAADARIIDSTELTAEEVVEQIATIVRADRGAAARTSAAPPPSPAAGR